MTLGVTRGSEMHSYARRTDTCLSRLSARSGVLVVGQSENRPPWKRGAFQRLMDHVQDDDWEYYLEVMIRLSAFKGGKRWSKLTSRLGVFGCADRMNLMPPRFEWDMPFASTVSEKLVILTSYSHIVLCGRRVARCFDHVFAYAPFGYYKQIWDDKLAIVVPHPSGLCRIWNDDTEVDRIAREVHKFHEESP